jgi:hypothetical protein
LIICRCALSGAWRRFHFVASAKQGGGDAHVARVLQFFKHDEKRGPGQVGDPLDRTGI